MIDTRRNARAGGSLSHLSVRKYVCESCATDLGLALGMVTDKSHTDVLDQFHTLEEKVEDLQTERDELLRSLDALKQAFRSDAVV